MPLHSNQPGQHVHSPGTSLFLVLIIRQSQPSPTLLLIFTPLPLALHPPLAIGEASGTLICGHQNPVNVIIGALSCVH